MRKLFQTDVLNELTSDIKQRNVAEEQKPVIAKWEKFGLLEGLSGQNRINMAVLLENQAGCVLKEASTMQGGYVEGFATVAFPMVRRAFASLIANDVVSVQPMSLPVGLIFFLDFITNSARLGYGSGDSVYGGGVVGSGLASGVDLTGTGRESGFYSMKTGYTSPTGSAAIVTTIVASGTVGGTYTGTSTYTALGDRLVQYDIDLSGSKVCLFTVPKSSFTNLDTNNLISISCSVGGQGQMARRLTREDPITSTNYILCLYATGSETTVDLSTSANASVLANFNIVDKFTTATALGAIKGTTPWDLEDEADLPEMEMKVDSIAIEAITKKLKVVWTQEFEQDMQAYQNIDANMELTQLMSEQVALEIDRLILTDLVHGARTGAGVYYWSRRPGDFLDLTTGTSVSTSFVPDFTGNIGEWYQHLGEIINQMSANIHTRIINGGANFIICGPEAANILESMNGFNTSIAVDDDKGMVGTQKIGSINRKFDVYLDPYFYRNVILVGRKGKQNLESGYVYAPYVPLQLTPMVLHPEKFTPRRAVMTRFGRKMIRPDFYGLIVIKNMFFG